MSLIPTSLYSSFPSFLSVIMSSSSLLLLPSWTGYLLSIPFIPDWNRRVNHVINIIKTNNNNTSSVLMMKNGYCTNNHNYDYNNYDELLMRSSCIITKQQQQDTAISYYSILYTTIIGLLFILVLWIMIEILFYIYYHQYMKWKVNHIESIQRIISSVDNNISISNKKKNSRSFSKKKNIQYLNHDLKPIHQRHYVVERVIDRTYQLACIEYYNHYYTTGSTSNNIDDHNHTDHNHLIMKIFQRKIQEHYVGWFYHPTEVPIDIITHNTIPTTTTTTKKHEKVYQMTKNYYHHFIKNKYHNDHIPRRIYQNIFQNKKNISNNNNDSNHGNIIIYENNIANNKINQNTTDATSTTNATTKRRLFQLNNKNTRLPFHIMLLWKSTSSLSSVSSSSSSSSSSTSTQDSKPKSRKKKYLPSLESSLISTSTSSTITTKSSFSYDSNDIASTTMASNNNDDGLDDKFIQKDVIMMDSTENFDDNGVDNNNRRTIANINESSDEISELCSIANNPQNSNVAEHNFTNNSSKIIRNSIMKSSSMILHHQRQRQSIHETWTIPYICKEDADQCCSLGYFQKYSYNDLNYDEKLELQYCYQILKERTGLVFYPKSKTKTTGDSNKCQLLSIQQQEQQEDISSSPSSPSSPSEHDNTTITNNNNKISIDNHDNKYQFSQNDGDDIDNNIKKVTYCLPRQLQLEKVTSLHRPLLFYILIQMIQYIVCHLILQYIFGFQRIKSKKQQNNGNILYGWYYTTSNKRRNNYKVTATTKTKMDQESTSNKKSKGNNLQQPQQEQQQQKQQKQKHKVYLFFHGVAPGGLVLYLPMLLFGIFRDHIMNRTKQTKMKDDDGNEEAVSIFLFENPNVSTTLGSYHALSEEETCQGIYELIHRCLGLPQKNITTKDVASNENESASKDEHDVQNRDSNIQLIVMGHSFGTCQVSWIVHSKLFTNWIHTIVLLDPVSILLSDPDVMINFFYHNNDNGKKRRYHKFIRLLGSSELFTQCYLRRHFAWYNSELWLEHDIHNNIANNNNNNNNNNWNILVALSGNDNIVNAKKVKNHVEYVFHQQSSNSDDSNNNSNKNTNKNEIYECSNNSCNEGKKNHNNKKQLIYWENAGHADCVKESCKWDELRVQIKTMVQKS